MRVVLDTNVLVSSTFWQGSSDKILRKVEAREIELILSKEIIEEFSGVLNYKEVQDKIKDKNLEIIRSVEKIVSIATIIEPKQKLNIIKEDVDDNIILKCAVEGKVDFIISYDSHLLKLKEFENIKIWAPEEFLKILPS